MSSAADNNPFAEWIRLEQPRLGTRVVFASDDFFAPKERLIEPADPVFLPDKYDDHGKWMDGWESRRKRGGGHDYCIVKLGTCAIVHGLDVDTSYFTGNYPPAVSIDACRFDGDIPGGDAEWHEILRQTAIGGNAHHFFTVSGDREVTHLRLNIYPDGGVARLRIFGEVVPDPARVAGGEQTDLLAFENGGRAVCCSDEHYGSMHNLNIPGRGIHMGDGWETARRRGGGNDWVIMALGRPGIVSAVEIDTAHFKGNYPGSARLLGALVDNADDLVAESENWPVLLPEMQLRADSVHVYSDEVTDIGVVSHIRLDIYPDGGVSRLRLFGTVAP